MRKLLILILFSTVFAKSFAQTNFVKGYYVGNNKDTVRGYIAVRSPKRNFEACIFKPNPESDPVTFTPGEISAFTLLDKDFYEVHEFKERKTNTSLIGFYRVVVRGRLSLFSVDDKIFLLNMNDAVYDITKYNERIDNAIREDYYAQRMLRSLTRDCTEITDEFVNSNSSKPVGMEKIVTRYNQCFPGKTYASSPVKLKSYFHAGVLGSVYGSQFIFAPGFGSVTLRDISFTGGAFASFSLPRINENAHLVVEVAYGKYSDYQFFSSTTAGGRRNNDLFFSYSFFRTPIFIRYTWKHIFIDVGMQNQFIQSQGYRWRTESIQQGSVFTTDEKMTPVKSRSLGVLGGLGYRYAIGKCSVLASARLSQSRVWHDTPYKNRNVEFMLAFQF